MLKDLDLNGKNILISGISKDNTLNILKDYLINKKQFFNISVVDIEPQSIMDLKNKNDCPKNRCSFYIADFCDINFIKDDSIDYIVLSHTLSSINERPFKALKALAEAQRVLKNTGIMFIKEKISTIGNKRTEYKFYNWYRSRKYALYALSKNISRAKIHFFLDDLNFSIKEMGFKIDTPPKWLKDEPIEKEQKENFLNELLEYKHSLSQFSEIFKMIRIEYDNLKTTSSVYPPNVILKCTLI